MEKESTIIQKRKCSEESKKHIIDSTKKSKTSTEGLDPEHPVRVYCDGVFDLFHIGHANLLEYCKKTFKYTTLIAGVHSDIDATREKGKPVMTELERAETVKHCKWVDEIICPCPWIPTVVSFAGFYKIGFFEGA